MKHATPCQPALLDQGGTFHVQFYLNHLYSLADRTGGLDGNCHILLGPLGRGGGKFNPIQKGRVGGETMVNVSTEEEGKNPAERDKIKLKFDKHND